MRRILSLATLLVLAACGHDDPTGPSPTPATVSGTYGLTMMDGQALPLLVLDIGGAYQVRVTSGALTLRPDGTYAYEIGLRIDDSGHVRTQTDTDGGLWNVKDGSLTLASTERAFSSTGVVTGEVITLQSSGREVVLAKKRP